MALPKLLLNLYDELVPSRANYIPCLAEFTPHSGAPLLERLHERNQRAIGEVMDLPRSAGHEHAL